MTTVKAPRSLSGILAFRMIAVSISLSVLLTLVFFFHYISDTPNLREATLRASVLKIAQTLDKGQDPSKLSLYRGHPQFYGFRVFDRRLLATRHVLASANTHWLPEVQHLKATKADPDGNQDLEAVGSDLLEGFERFHPVHAQTPGGRPVSQLIERVVLPNHKYWVQAYMIGDPAWAGMSIIIRKLISHVAFPVLFIVPALTLAMFLATSTALRPLRRISSDANLIGNAVARGQMLVPLSERGMAREFMDVATTINTMLAKLERSLQLQKQFTSDAAHELRTPLAVLLLEVSQLPPGPTRERLKADLDELGRLVHELLRFAEAEDVLAYQFNNVDLVAAVRKVCEDAAIGAVARRQSIEFDCAASHMIVLGNAVLIEIAIRNLIENALKYSPPNTAVTIRIEPGPVVIVEDRGPGIPAAKRDIVFERFWRADKQSGNGAGVGLALVRRIAQLHDGSVQMQDRPSGGTRMVLSFIQTHVTRDRTQTLYTA